jgi:hypothetical protein
MEVFIFALVTMLVALVVVGLGAVLFFPWGEGSGIAVIVLGLLLGLISLNVAYDAGVGNVLNRNLRKNAIYVTLSSVAVGNGEYAVITRLQSGDGELRASLVSEDPPKMFKATGDSKKPFLPFP